MKLLFTLLSAITVLACSASELSFLTPAPLRAHLLTVNPEWARHDLHLPMYDRIVAYDSDAERITEHLLLTVEHLKSVGQDVESTVKRQLMAQLSEYALAGQFPTNKISSVRTPIFIDNQNVHCAVSYLMISNGFGTEAKRISQINNMVLVRQIPTSMVTSWADFSSLTLDEMALIQPGYPPQQAWASYGEPFIGTVNDIRSFNGTIYLTGDLMFGSEQTALAKLVDNVFQPVAGITGTGNKMEIFESGLWIAGQFGNNNLARVDENDSALLQQVGSSKYPMGYTLVAHENFLYLSSDASGIVAMSAIHSYDGEQWTPIGTGLGATYALVWHGDALYAAGEMNNIYDEQGIGLSVASWNGQNWAQAATGIQDVVRGLWSNDGELWACGRICSGGTAGFGYAWLQEGGWATAQSWEQVLGQETIATQNLTFWGFAEVNGSSFVYGNMPFNNSSMSLGSLVFEFYPNIELPTEFPFHMGGGVFPTVSNAGPSVNAMHFDGQKFWAGGDFETSNFNPVSRVAASDDFVNSVVNPDLFAQVAIYPNPSRDVFNVQFSAGNFTSAYLRDANGKRVFSGIIRDGDSAMTIPCASLSAGSYTLQLTGIFDASRTLVVE